MNRRNARVATPPPAADWLIKELAKIVGYAFVAYLLIRTGLGI